jgi:Na+/H+ antiporter NhaD/arsenite permease-like protein
MPHPVYARVQRNSWFWLFFCSTISNVRQQFLYAFDGIELINFLDSLQPIDVLVVVMLYKFGKILMEKKIAVV